MISRFFGFMVLGFTLVAIGLGLFVLFQDPVHDPGMTLQVSQNVDSGLGLSFVSGTEYGFGADGQVIVEARDRFGTPVQTDCVATVWYPNKSVFINQMSMVYSSSGNSYINFTVPSVRGVYEYQATCTVGSFNRTVSKSFHVSQPKISAQVVK